jgi:hypothetical protein
VEAAALVNDNYLCRPATIIFPQRKHGNQLRFLSCCVLGFRCGWLPGRRGVVVRKPTAAPAAPLRFCRSTSRRPSPRWQRLAWVLSPDNCRRQTRG